MTAQSQRTLAELSDLNPEAVLFDNMDSALIGLGYIANEAPVAVYSRAKIYDKLLRDGFSQDDADEYYAGKFVALRAGNLTPVIIDDLKAE
jgi:hypothetical protein